MWLRQVKRRHHIRQMLLVNRSVYTYNIMDGMNLTTSQELKDITKQLQNLAPNEIPSMESVVQLSFLFALKGIRDLLLIYPINVILLLTCLFYFSYKIVCLVSKPKMSVQWPNQHVESHDLHIRNFKKDIRELQDESMSLSRRVETKKRKMKKEDEEAGGKNGELGSEPIQEGTSTTSQDLTELLRERQYIKEVSNEFISEFKVSEARILEKIRKYQR